MKNQYWNASYGTPSSTRSWVALAGLVLSLSCGNRSDNGTGSSTHFFARECVSSAQCGPLACVCSVCTHQCATNADCAGLASDAVCADPPNPSEACAAAVCMPASELTPRPVATPAIPTTEDAAMSCPDGGCGSASSSSANPSPDANVTPSEVPDAGSAPTQTSNTAPTASMAPDAAPAPDATQPTCEVDACSDSGTCIERLAWTLCDCDPAALPPCELPLFREIGPSRDNDELQLITISGDGSTIVGNTRPHNTQDPLVGVRWTLLGGVEVLEQHPAGPTRALGVSVDGTLITGVIDPVDGGPEVRVRWLDGVLELGAEDDLPPATHRAPPSLTQFDELLDQLGLPVGWSIFAVNAISDDGKVIFGLGVSTTHGARWVLRMP